MEWKDLAPWIAIAFTLALSILVPPVITLLNAELNTEKRSTDANKRIIIGAMNNPRHPPP